MAVILAQAKGEVYTWAGGCTGLPTMTMYVVGKVSSGDLPSAELPFGPESWSYQSSDPQGSSSLCQPVPG